MSQGPKSKPKLVRSRSDVAVEASLHHKVSKEVAKMRNNLLLIVLSSKDIDRKALLSCIRFLVSDVEKVADVPTVGAFRKQLEATLSAVSWQFANTPNMTEPLLEKLNGVLDPGIQGVKGDLVQLFEPEETLDDPEPLVVESDLPVEVAEVVPVAPVEKVDEVAQPKVKTLSVEIPDFSEDAAFIFINQCSFLKEVLREFVLNHLGGYGTNSEFLRKYDFNKGVLRGVTNSLNSDVKPELVRVILDEKSQSLQDLFNEKDVPFQWSNEGFSIRISEDSDNSSLSDLLHAIQEFKPVRTELIENFISLVKEAIQSGAWQQGLIKLVGKNKSYWDSLVKGATRIKFEWAEVLHQAYDVPLGRFFKSSFSSLEGASNKDKNEVSVANSMAEEGEHPISSLLLNNESEEGLDDRVDQLIEGASLNKDFKIVVVNRLLIMCIWAMAHYGVSGNNNANVCAILSIENTRAFSRMKQNKMALEKEYVDQALDVLQINLSLLQEGSNQLGLPLELIEENFNLVKKDPDQYQVMKANFLREILNHTEQNKSKAERIFLLGENALHRLKADKTKLSLFWLIRACATLEIPVTQIMPIVLPRLKEST